MKEDLYALIKLIKSPTDSGEAWYHSLEKLLDKYPEGLIPEMIEVFHKEDNEEFKSAWAQMIIQRVCFQEGINFLKCLSDQPYTDEEIAEVMVDANMNKIF